MTGAHSHAGLVTAFVALQDVSRAMGPTEAGACTRPHLCST